MNKDVQTEKKGRQQMSDEEVDQVSGGIVPPIRPAVEGASWIMKFLMAFRNKQKSKGSDK